MQTLRKYLDIRDLALGALVIIALVLGWQQAYPMPEVSDTTQRITTLYVEFSTLEQAIPTERDATIRHEDYTNEGTIAAQYNALVSAHPQSKPNSLPPMLVAQTEP